MEKEIDQFMVKVRSAYHFDTESKLKKIQNNHVRLTDKVNEVNKEIITFNSEINTCSTVVLNKDQLLHDIDYFSKLLLDVDAKKDMIENSI